MTEAKKTQTTKPKRGRPFKERSEDLAKQVLAAAQFGIRHEDIAHALGMCVETLNRLYSEELKKGGALANLQVAQRLYKKATEEGDTSAMIFWLKTKAGWRETSHQEIDLTTRERSLQEMSDAELVTLLNKVKK